MYIRCFNIRRRFSLLILRFLIIYINLVKVHGINTALLCRFNKQLTQRVFFTCDINFTKFYHTHIRALRTRLYTSWKARKIARVNYTMAIYTLNDKLYSIGQSSVMIYFTRNNFFFLREKREFFQLSDKITNADRVL